MVKGYEKRLEQIEGMLEELAEERGKSAEERRKREQEFEKTQKEIEQNFEKIQKEVGKIGNAVGYFVEGLVTPAVPNIARTLEMKVAETYQEASASVNGQWMEVDVLCAGSRIVDNKGVVIVVSVKSRLQIDDVKEFIKDIGRFPLFFRRYRGTELLGMVAGINIVSGVKEYAEKMGLLVIGSSGDAVKLLNSKDFRPKIWKI